MKKTFLIVLYLALIMLREPAQTANSPASQSAAAAVPPPTPYQTVSVGTNFRVWQRLTYEPMPNGQMLPHVHRYTELASGLNYLDSSGLWTASQAKIEAFSGGGIAQQGQYQAIFASDLNTAGAIDMQTPDGKELRGNILGLLYSDPTTGQCVQIAAVQDSEGQLIADNQVLYSNAQ